VCASTSWPGIGGSADRAPSACAAIGTSSLERRLERGVDERLAGESLVFRLKLRHDVGSVIVGAAARRRELEAP